LGFRLNAAPRAEIRVVDDAGTVHVVDLIERSSYRTGGRRIFSGTHDPGRIVLWHDGEARAFHVYRADDSMGSGVAADGAIISPMPGKLIAVEVAEGDAVTKGQKLVTLEAMKMEHSLVAPYDGVVAELNASEGAQVSEGALLARIEKGEGA
jgi:3-methylcrotonyl-CoA carboxylase alpha subunit